MYEVKHGTGTLLNAVIGLGNRVSGIIDCLEATAEPVASRRSVGVTFLLEAANREHMRTIFGIAIVLGVRRRRLGMSVQ